MSGAKSLKLTESLRAPLPVGLLPVKTNDMDKHVDPKAEDLRTRVQFPPPPPYKSLIYKRFFINHPFKSAP